MKGGFLDHHSYEHSTIHDLHPYTKVTASSAVMVLAIIVSQSNFSQFIPLALFLLTIVFLSRLSIMHMLSKMTFPMIITLLTVMFIPFFKPSVHFIIPFGKGLPLKVYTESSFFAIHIVSRAFIVLFSVVLLTSVTPFRDIIKVLHRIKLPDIFLRILSVFYRYLFIFSNESEKMQKAIKARHLRSNSILYFKMASNIAGTIFLRSLERGEKTYQSMCARGFEGHFSDIHLPPWKKKEVVLTVLVVCILCVVTVLVGRVI